LLSRGAPRQPPLGPGPAACPPLYTSDGYVAPWLPYCPSAAPAAARGGGAPPLVAAPDTRTLRRPAHTALDVRPCEAAPRFAVVVSAHDAAHVLGRNVEALLKHTTGLWELIVVLDACRDGSEAAARAALLRGLERAADVGGLVRARLVVQPDAIWETSSDNLGMQLADARTEWLLLVQADIQVGERGWNARLALPGEVWRDVWAVSGRAAHNVACGRYEDTPGFNMTAGRDLEALPSAEALQAAAKTFYIRDALNRGPVALRADVARGLGFFNERDFHLGRDEHELMLRAYVDKGLRCGYYDVGFAMPKGDGASRRKGRKSQRSTRDWAYLVYRLARKQRAAAAANAVALGKLPHWNEERAVPPDALPKALQAAEQQQSDAACGSGRMTIR